MKVTHLLKTNKDETDASLNAKYDTADHKKDEITKDGVKYYLTAKELKMILNQLLEMLLKEQLQ